MLTRKQFQLLQLIDQHIRTSGFAPSFEEMRAALGLRSKSGVHRLITALEERGFLRRQRHRARALEVLRLPQEPPAAAFTPTVIQGHFATRFAPNRAPAPALPHAIAAIPLYGRIAAGLPIEALRDPGTSIEVPSTLLGGGEHYALQVTGDSMIEAGIMEGDIVILRRTEEAENGQIVVALIDENEVTLKRLRKRGNSIALEPANPRHETRIFPADRVRVQGVLVALLRRYV
jgi:repressor LexA